MSTTLDHSVFDRALAITGDIQLPNGMVVLLDQHGTRPFLQIAAMRPDARRRRAGNPDGSVWQKGGKRYLSEHMTDREIVGLIFQAALDFEEHEFREHFTYKGKAIFGPHVSLESLLAVADDLEVRS